MLVLWMTMASNCKNHNGQCMKQLCVEQWKLRKIHFCPIELRFNNFFLVRWGHLFSSGQWAISRRDVCDFIGIISFFISCHLECRYDGGTKMGQKAERCHGSRIAEQQDWTLFGFCFIRYLPFPAWEYICM